MRTLALVAAERTIHRFVATDPQPILAVALGDAPLANRAPLPGRALSSHEAP